MDLAVHEVFNFVDAASLLAELFQTPRSDSHHDYPFLRQCSPRA